MVERQGEVMRRVLGALEERREGGAGGEKGVGE
jgi:hypothetical protein